MTRLSTAPATQRWSDRLALDVALMLEGSGETPKTLAAHHKITEAELLSITADPLFAKRVEVLTTEVREKGLTFRLKARTQAEELLITSWDLIHDNMTSAAVKADLIKSIVKWGGLEPKNEEVQANTGGVTIQINLAGRNVPFNVVEDGGTATLLEGPDGEERD